LKTFEKRSRPVETDLPTGDLFSGLAINLQADLASSYRERCGMYLTRFKLWRALD
jgi:hypothetical protein